MSTCRCRRIKLDPYEGLSLRDKCALATKNGDWEIARECYDELNKEALGYQFEAAKATEEAKNARAAQKREVTKRQKAEKRAKDAEAERDRVLNMTDDEKVEARVKREVKKELDRRSSSTTRSDSTYTQWVMNERDAVTERQIKSVAEKLSDYYANKRGYGSSTEDIW